MEGDRRAQGSQFSSFRPDEIDSDCHEEAPRPIFYRTFAVAAKVPGITLSNQARTKDMSRGGSLTIEKPKPIFDSGKGIVFFLG